MSNKRVAVGGGVTFVPEVALWNPWILQSQNDTRCTGPFSASHRHTCRNNQIFKLMSHIPQCYNDSKTLICTYWKTQLNCIMGNGNPCGLKIWICSRLYCFSFHHSYNDLSLTSCPPPWKFNIKSVENFFIMNSLHSSLYLNKNGQNESWDSSVADSLPPGIPFCCISGCIWILLPHCGQNQKIFMVWSLWRCPTSHCKEI